MKTIAAIFRFFLSLRYDVELKGEDLLKGNSARLILPNHQALVDPQIMGAYLYKYIDVVPVVTESFFNIPVLKTMLKMVGAVPVSDLTAGSRDLTVLDTIFNNVVKALKNNKNVLLYPSGQIAGQGYEKIFNKQSAWIITKNLPENTQVIGVRIRGLWGSMWSRAWNGKSPDFFKTFLKALFYVVTNGFFFLPRRKVTIEFFNITEQAKVKANESKNTFNNFLEELYNQPGEEKPLFLKHFFFASELKREVPDKIEGSVNDLMNGDTFGDKDIPDTIFKKVISIIAQTANIGESEIKINSSLNLDLNIDSLGLIYVIAEIEDQFNVISQMEVTSLKTTEDLCRVAMGIGINVEKLKPSYLHKFNSEIEKIEVDKTKNIVELFLKTANKYKNEPFVYDKMLGTATRKEFLLKAMVVSRILKKEVDGKYVGIMLPALQSTSLLVIATFLAGKIPVMLNWTVGKKVLEYCVESVDIKKIITAKPFFDKVADLLPDSVKVKCIFFEQKVKETSVITKLSGLLNSYLQFVPKYKMDDVAVILFTSGSEALPKAVPLSHKNIISDLSGALSIFKMNNDKIFLAFLPPFHSFGFTILTILPLVSGIKVAYTPDPTDSREVLKILKHTKANTVLGTPTFLKMVLSIASPIDLKRVELALSGAESLHGSIIKTFYEKANEHAKIIEGYGITECSPILTLNTLDLQKEKSVGKFIEGLDFLIADIHNFSPLAQGMEGMIMVRGDSVFKGYYDKNLASPFEKINGMEYYKTGDLGYLDEDGFLFITGRLKRFIKIGGEMISLPAIENALLKKYGSEEKVILAVEGNDSIEPPQIVLFSTVQLEIGEINLYLKENGFSSLVKIHKIIETDEIPLLGTGKTDYKILKEMIR